MPRRRASQTSLSSENSASSEYSENSFVFEEFPDTGLAARARGKKTGGKRKRNIARLNERKGNEPIVDMCDQCPYPATGQVDRASQTFPLGIPQPPDAVDLLIQRAKAKKPVTKKQDQSDQDAAEELTKQERRDAIEMKKMYRPSECMKHMNVEVHPALLREWFVRALPAACAAARVRLVAAPDICEPSAVMWTRTQRQHLRAAAGQVSTSPRRVHCHHCLYVMTASAAAELAGGSLPPRGGALPAHIHAKKELLGARLTLVIVGAAEYFNKSKKRSACGYPQTMSESDLEIAITELLVSCQVETILVDTAEELADLILQYTKAIAEDPYKKAKREIDEKASFYMRGDNKNCVAVDKDGNGLSRLWQQMLSVLPNSSLEIARAISAQYDSPISLEKELSANGITNLSELVVSRAGGDERARRLGPELARRLYTLIMTDDGNEILQ